MLAAFLRFDVRPEHRDTFLQALAGHGRAALPDEPGTLRFDVLVDHAEPNRIYLYEAYADGDAFTTHLSGESHQQFVRTLSEHDWLTEPLAGPPRPFAPFIVGLGNAAFTTEEARTRPARRAPHTPIEARPPDWS